MVLAASIVASGAGNESELPAVGEGVPVAVGVEVGSGATVAVGSAVFVPVGITVTGCGTKVGVGDTAQADNRTSKKTTIIHLYILRSGRE